MTFTIRPWNDSTHQPLSVYVVTWEPYHENGSVLAVFSSLRGAERYVEAELPSTDQDDCLEIYETPFDRDGEAPRVGAWQGTKPVPPREWFIRKAGTHILGTTDFLMQGGGEVVTVPYVVDSFGGRHELAEVTQVISALVRA